ncbi:MAG: glycosyltransferase, partial [Candidatus Asgardarchaeia archaeon]
IGLLKRYPDLKLKNKIVIVPSGVDIHKFKPMNKEKLRKKHSLDKFDNIILFAGRHSQQKNLNLLIRSFSIIEKKIKKSALIILGRGELTSELRLLSRRLHIKNILFMGEVSSELVPEFINCADVVAISSWYEAS